MNRSTEQIQLIVVGGVYFFVLMLLICSLQLLIKMARIQMKPRQKYVKPDPLFKSYDAQQNWNWDWVMVFRVYGPDSYVSDYQRHYSLRLIVERLEMGGLQTKLYKSYHYDKIFCKIRCTSDRLKDQAAAVDYPLLMDETEVKMRIERGYRDEFGKYKWYPRRDGWKLASEGDEGEKLEKTFNNAIVDTEGQSGYAFNEHIYGKYDKRGDLQSPSVYVTYPASNSIFRSVDRLKLRARTRGSRGRSTCRASTACAGTSTRCTAAPTGSSSTTATACWASGRRTRCTSATRDPKRSPGDRRCSATTSTALTSTRTTTTARSRAPSYCPW